MIVNFVQEILPLCRNDQILKENLNIIYDQHNFEEMFEELITSWKEYNDPESPGQREILYWRKRYVDERLKNESHNHKQLIMMNIIFLPVKTFLKINIDEYFKQTVERIISQS